MLDVKALLKKILQFFQFEQSIVVNGAQGGVVAQKRSGIVTLDFQNIHNMSANTYYTLCTLPQTFRPSNTKYFVIRHPSDTYRLRVEVLANGTVQIYSYGTAIPNTNANVFQSITYVGRY